MQLHHPHAGWGRLEALPQGLVVFQARGWLKLAVLLARGRVLAGKCLRALARRWRRCS